jgi:hypothetical protein
MAQQGVLAIKAPTSIRALKVTKKILRIITIGNEVKMLSDRIEIKLILHSHLEDNEIFEVGWSSKYL